MQEVCLALFSITFIVAVVTLIKVYKGKYRSNLLIATVSCLLIACVSVALLTPYLIFEQAQNRQQKILYVLAAIGDIVSNAFSLVFLFGFSLANLTATSPLTKKIKILAAAYITLAFASAALGWWFGFWGYVAATVL